MIYILAGLLVSTIFTFGVMFVSEKRAGLAAITTSINSMVGMTVTASAVHSILTSGSYYPIIFYALGIGIGTYAATKLRS